MSQSSTAVSAAQPAPEAGAPPLREVKLPMMLVLSLIVGIIAGLGAIVFKYLIALIYNFSFYGVVSPFLDTNSFGPPSPWGAAIILVPVLGGLIVVYLVETYAPEARGHGVPEVMYAIYHKGGNVRGVVAVIKSVASAISIGTGASVGREGPFIQIGSSFGSTFGRLLGLVQHQKITLLSAGAGAGMAATFNTPLGGMLFASEILLPEVSTRTFLPVVVATATSTYTYRYAMGAASAFVVPLQDMGLEPVNLAELVVAGILGAIMGVAAWIFIRALAKAETVFEDSKLNPYLQNVIGMTIVGITGYVFLLASGQYHVLSAGYATIQAVLNGEHMGVALLLLLFVGKLVATCFSLGSGASGGIFSPCLFMGATLGGAIGLIGNQLLPGFNLSPEIFAIIGMGAMVGSATSAGMTAIVMIFEMTRDYQIILPLVLAVAVALGVRRALIVADIYTIKLRNRGKPIPVDRTTNMFLVQPVTDVMARDFKVLPASMTVVEALKEVDPEHTRVVLSDGNRIIGFVRFLTIPYHADRYAGQTLGEIGETEFIIAGQNSILNTVMTRMSRRQRSYAIVVKDVRGVPRPEDIVGVIGREEIARAVVRNHYG
ncbi:chloride channel protein [Consotaella salsifontis]|uniref:Chloride channel protein, CIC family n=1 Tax=Consotaella salsifontis TaxID=1365950 RepID=A0A1T4L1H7_9HYPH|nr:chloride channel protein [Consotaella salsifontis]SJZ48565.1 chloride channel protein, CIC family [Consotaella salsifontis]